MQEVDEELLLPTVATNYPTSAVAAVWKQVHKLAAGKQVLPLLAPVPAVEQYACMWLWSGILDANALSLSASGWFGRVLQQLCCYRVTQLMQNYWAHMANT